MRRSAAHRAGLRAAALRPAVLRPAGLLPALALLCACAGSLPGEAPLREAPLAELPAFAERLEQRVGAARDDAEALRQLAVAEVRLGRAEAAVGHALRAVQAEPFLGAGHLVLGEAYEAAGRPARALAAYSQAIALEPGLILAYVRHAQVQARLHARDGALRTLREALRREPRHFGAWLLRARLLREQDELARALEAIETARALRPGDADALAEHIAILQRRGQVHAALRLVEEGLLRQPDDPTLLAVQARLHRERGDWSLALRVLERLERVRPLAPPERLLRTELLEAQGRGQEAEGALQALLRDVPDYAPARLRRAEALLQGGKAREALREAQQGAALLPLSAEAHYWEAAAHYALEDEALGDAALELAARLDPEQQAVALLRIERLLAARRLDAAGALLEDLLRSEPERPALLLLHAEHATLRGDLGLAEQVLDRLPPPFAPHQVRFARLRIAYLERRWEDALTLSEPLLAHPRLGWRAVYLRGSALLRLRRGPEGLALVEPRLEEPERRVLFFHLAGYLHLLQGERTAAQRTFLAGLALRPGSPLMIEGLSRMAIEARDWARATELLRQGLDAPERFRALFIERLAQVSRAQGDAEESQRMLSRYLELSDPARGQPATEPASPVLYGAYLPAYTPHIAP